MFTPCESGAMAQRGEIQCAGKSACAIAGYGAINNLRFKAYHACDLKKDLDKEKRNVSSLQNRRA